MSHNGGSHINKMRVPSHRDKLFAYRECLNNGRAAHEEYDNAIHSESDISNILGCIIGK